MRTILLLTLLCSCTMFKPVIKPECELQYLGRYDTCCTIKENFLKGTTTIVFMDDDSCVVIWGKKCEFDKGDSLFAEARWWSTPPGGAHWKYFLVNEDKTLKYSLLDR